MYESEQKHLEAFVGFIKHENLARPLREGDWSTFARRYNGPGYQKNNYAKKMKRAYEKEKGLEQ